ncbi:hypothetical protein [Mycobacterium sp. 1274761.0]|nr:hypothetical protein [Mycobacterium sp. 1274761.0]
MDRPVPCSHSDIRAVAGDLGVVFDFVDPDGVQIELIHMNLG